MASGSSKEIVLEVQSRDQMGGTACKRMRREGRVPGNVYGLDRPPFPVSVNPRRITALLQLGSGVNTVFQLALAGESKKREAMIKELQRDPVSELPVHVDFIRVDPTKTIHVSVPVHLEGVPDGVKNEGGLLDFIHRTIEVECLPGAIPEHYDVDVSELHIGQHVSVSDLAPREGAEILDDANQILAVVNAPKAEEEPVADEEAELAEGEVAETEEGKEGAAPAADGEKKEE